MAKRKKKKEARMTDEQRARKELIETIGVLRCPDDTIEELSYVMQNAVVNSGMAYRFATFAELTWANRPANRGEIVAIAHALKEEHQRYRVAVEALLDRVDALGTPEHDEKEHLDPQDVLARLQPFFDEVMNEVDPPG